MTDPVETAIRSAIEGIAWPGVPAATGAATLALLFQLERTQWWPEQRLLERQRQQLSALLRHAQRHVPFWRARLTESDVTLPADDSWLDAWRRLPILTRAEVQAAEEQETLLADVLPPGHGEFREIHTSGSTGRPIRGVRSQLWELIWSAFTVRDHLWHGRDLRGTLAVIRDSTPGKAPYPDGLSAPGWGYSSATVFETGPMVSLNITTPVAQQAEWLARQNPDYLLTHPSMAQRLAEACIAQGLGAPRLRQVITIAETLGPGVREACRKAWGAEVADIYSTREIGYLALQCPEHAHYHVQSESVFLEVVDAAGRPCGPGEVGRVLVTPLHNLAMPMIRFDLGDMAEPGPPCGCGRGLPVLRRVHGRVQNMLLLPSGERRWPLLSSGDIAALREAAPPIRRYQFVQTALDAITLRLAAARPLDAPERDAAIAWAQRKFGSHLRVEVVEEAELPLSPAGKFEEFRCEVPDSG